MSDISKIFKKLSEIDSKIDELLQWKAAQEERCVAHREKTEELRTEIFGEEGVKIKVQRLLNCKGAFRDRIALWRDFGMYVLKAIVVACLLAAIAFLLKTYKSS